MAAPSLFCRYGYPSLSSGSQRSSNAQMGATVAAPARIGLSIDSETLAQLGDPVPKTLALVVVEEFVTVPPERFPKDGPQDLIVAGFPSGSRYTTGGHGVV